MFDGNIPNLNPNPYLGKQLRVLNEMASRLNSSQVLIPDSSSIDAIPGAYGTTFDLHSETPQVHSFEVVLFDKGPSGEKDFIDGRYWAMKVLVGQPANAKQTDAADLYIDQTVGMWYGVVHNLTELTTKTHMLQTHSGDRTKAVIGVETYTVTQMDSLKKTTEPHKDIPNCLFTIKTGLGVREAKISGPPEPLNGGLIEWAYPIEIGHWKNTAFDRGTWVKDWDTDINGDQLYAYNSLEDKNVFVGSGTSGGGLTVASTTGIINAGTCQLQPLPEGGYVVVKYRCTTDGVPYFTIINASNSGQ